MPTANYISDFKKAFGRITQDDKILFNEECSCAIGMINKLNRLIKLSCQDQGLL